MLFLKDDVFIDVVREPQFEDTVTVCASSALALAKFRRYSEGEIIVNADPMAAFPYMVHVSPHDAAHLLEAPRVHWSEKELNISPEPVAFCFMGYQKEGGDQTWGYCWPDEVDSLRYAFDDLEDVRFFPLFKVPEELEKTQEQANG